MRLLCQSVSGSMLMVLLLSSSCSTGSGSKQEGTDVVADSGAEDTGSTVEDVASVPDFQGDVSGHEEIKSEVGDDGKIPPLEEPTSECHTPELAVCEQLKPSPSEETGIQSFAVNNAFRLVCPEASGDGWDFTVFHREFQDHQVFFMGEIHGSNEIGPASAALFEYMVRYGGVTVLALEIGMDTSVAMNEYVQTGSQDAAKAFGVDQYSDVMFRKILPEKARSLVEEGFDISVVGIDVPGRLAWVNEQLQDLSDGISDQQVQGLIIETLPPPKNESDYGMLGLDNAYVELARDYYDHVMDNLDTICTAFDEAGCERVEYLAYSLWIGSVFVSQDFMMGAMGGGDQTELMAMMMEREQILIWNYINILPDSETRVYSHVGAAHASQAGWNVAGQLAKFHAPTMDRIYSTAPAYGPGSEVFYGIMTQAVPTEPAVAGASLAGLPEENYYLSTVHPGLDCTDNPFLDEPVPQLGNLYGTSWDAFFFFRHVTADSPGGWWYVIPESARDRFYREATWRMQYAETLLREIQ
jgi:hypothetical protein